MIKDRDKTNSDMQQKLEELESEIVSLNQKVDTLNRKYVKLSTENSSVKRKHNIANLNLQNTKRELNLKSFTMKYLRDKPDVVKFYTGFATYSEFSTLLNFLSPDINYVEYWGSTITKTHQKRNHGLSSEDQLLLLLSRLRVGLLTEDLAYR